MSLIMIKVLSPGIYSLGKTLGRSVNSLVTLVWDIIASLEILGTEPHFSHFYGLCPSTLAGDSPVWLPCK